jgi:hypothetical protein
MQSMAVNEIQLLLDQYDRTMDGQAWYGDPVWKILDGIDAACAEAAQLPDSHTIWQLVKHMAFWEDVATRRFAGPVEPDLAANFPSTPKLGEPRWRETLEQFRSSNARFREAVSKVGSAVLDELTPDAKYTYRYEIVGVIQHHIYHIGQIAILKKAYRSGK